MSKLVLPYKYKPRPYQLNFWKSMWSEHDKQGVKRACIVFPRRSGKDITALNYMITQMFARVGNYYYYLPSAEQGRKIIWDGKKKDGKPFLSHFPENEIEGKDKNRMQLRLKNGSYFQIMGADKVESVGTNPVGVVFSEYSINQNTEAWDFIRPILMENDGWAIFIFTPRGMNHAYDLFLMADQDDRWFCERLTADDIIDHKGNRIITDEMINDERDQGMSENLIQQEFFTSFDEGLEGAYYAKQIREARDDQRITDVPYVKGTTVHTAWDIGVHDSTAIWFFQIVGKEVHVLNYYENSGEGIAHYKKILQKYQFDHNYLYGKHFAPFDIEKQEMGSGLTIREQARDLGIKYYVLEKERNILDGIEAVRSLLRRCWFDKRKCGVGIKHLEQYKKKWNSKMHRYSDTPLHDQHSDGADAFRYLARAFPRVKEGSMTPEEVEQLDMMFGCVA